MDTEANRTAAPAANLPTLLKGYVVPRLGTLWSEQGGIFAGMCRGEDGAPDYALILALDPRARFEDREWGVYDKDVPLACNRNDGMANTVAMAGAGSALATEILALDIAGFTDWHLPSQAELQTVFANAREHLERGDWYWTSTQYSPRNAWVQYFEDGDSYIGSKDNEFRAVAVRRSIL